MKEEENNIRNLFDSYEADYQTGDWESMEFLLDSNTEELPLVPPIAVDTKKQINANQFFSIMTITTLLTATILLGKLNASYDNAAEIKPIITETNVEVLADQPVSTPNDEESFYTNSILSSTTETNSTEGTVTRTTEQTEFVEPTASINSGGTPTESTVNPSLSIEKDSIKKGDSLGFYKVVLRRYWVDDRYEYKYLDPSRDIEDFWFGMHYAQQDPFNANLWDSIGRRTKTHGFSLQFMSGNILGGENFAIYGGLDWGMQFYGRSDKDTVIINSVNEDKGFSFMRSHTNDILMRWHFEYAAFPVVPYFNLGVGTRIFTTGQTINGLVDAKDYETSTEHALKTRATKLMNFSVGTKFRISPRTHLDFRYEWNFAGNANVVDYNSTRFNGTQYNLKFKNMDLSSNQFKVGFIFDLSYDERERVLVEEGHYEEVTQELYVTENESKMIVPCEDIRKNPKPKNEEENDYKTHPFDGVLDGVSNGNGGTVTPSGGGGRISGGKKDFPGLKKPPIKN